MIVRQLSRMIVKINGGVWETKRKINECRRKILREILIEAYTEHLARFGSWISCAAHFENKPVFPHGVYGVFISEGARIGKNCVILQHVTIGSNTLADSKGAGAPIIGDNCYIGAGAKIIGGITIGNNCRIGANCVVYKDMPDNSVAVLQETRIVQKESLDNRYYGWGVGKN